MKIIATFLMKVWVKQFYIINAGFFLFLFFFFFGIINGGQLIYYHRSLIAAMISSPVFMGCVWVAWLLYNIKCILFCVSSVKGVDSSYIYALKAVSPFKQWMIYLFICTALYMPVLAYSCFVVYLALTRSLLSVALLVAIYQLIMIAMAAGILYLTINKNRVTSEFEKTIAMVSSWYGMKLGYNGFLLGYMLDSKKMAFAIVKIFSLLLLSVSFVINGDHFDEDLFNIFFLLIFVAHAVLVFYAVDFSESQLQFSRNLPVALYKIAAMYLFTYGVFLLPEAAFLLINNHGNLPLTGLLLLYLTSVFTLFLCTSILYGCGLDMESYMFFVFITFLMIFFLQKTELKLLTMTAIFFTAAAVFKSYYYSFEREK